MDEYLPQGIAQLLVLENLLTPTEALKYHQAAIQNENTLIQYLIKHNILTAMHIARTAANHFGVPLIDIHSIAQESIPINLIHEKLISEHQMLPLYVRENTLFLATDDPGKQVVLKEIQFHTGLNVSPLVAEADKLAQVIDQLLSAKAANDVDDSFRACNIVDEELSSFTSDDAPLVQFVNKIVQDAVKQGASDIHFEPYEQEYRIRYRQDGILHEVARPPVSLSARITARIKIMAHLDISERRVPQDGGFKMTCFKERPIDFRVSTCPTAHGEKVVMRILDAESAKLGIEALGFTAQQQAHFVKAIERPQGMILVTGPTGSGKTVTLYSALNLLNTPEVNISTAEDPIEIKIPGINQVNINPKAGLTFSGALRSFLRQDPNIIMVGEVRDLETAEIAVKAAQTGHLVLSTLHTNSASETLNRLLNMGISSFNIASSVSIIIAQRLARKLCEHCKTPKEDISLGKIYKAVGCNQCTNGYKGRIGLFEVLPMTRDLEQLILAGGNALELLELAQSEGMLTVFAAGIAKVKEGITSIEEVNRVTID